jgi:hypothetical protein
MFFLRSDMQTGIEMLGGGGAGAEEGEDGSLDLGELGRVEGRAKDWKGNDQVRIVPVMRKAVKTLTADSVILLSTRFPSALARWAAKPSRWSSKRVSFQLTSERMSGWSKRLELGYEGWWKIDEDTSASQRGREGTEAPLRSWGETEMGK